MVWLMQAGEYIGFLDDDDFFIDDDALEKLYDTASKNDANMATGNIKLVNAKENFPHSIIWIIIPLMMLFLQKCMGFHGPFTNAFSKGNFWMKTI